MKIGEYILEIYSPRSVDDVWVTFESSTPFMQISVGDSVNPGLWPSSQSPMRILRVIQVEHIIWESENKVKHKVLVFTEEVESSEITQQVAGLDDV